MAVWNTLGDSSSLGWLSYICSQLSVLLPGMERLLAWAAGLTGPQVFHHTVGLFGLLHMMAVVVVKGGAPIHKWFSSFCLHLVCWHCIIQNMSHGQAQSQVWGHSNLHDKGSMDTMKGIVCGHFSNLLHLASKVRPTIELSGGILDVWFWHNPKAII